MKGEKVNDQKQVGKTLMVNRILWSVYWKLKNNVYPNLDAF